MLAKPGWSHPTLSQDEIRKNGGVPPPPQPIFPTEFAVQLYNPDLQVLVKHQTAKWSSTLSWEFSLPQVTFRLPSSSDLDRALTDPAANATTPRVNFVWRKEGRMGKDMTCYMTGKSTDVVGKKAKKSKEPDIAVALFSGLKELTIMEPNLYRLDLEDFKGLEVALLLGAAVIRDLFFSDPAEQFHINGANIRKNSGGLRARKGSSPQEAASITPPVMTPQPPPPPAYSGPSQYPPEKVPLQPARGAAINAQIAPPSYSNRVAAKRLSLPPLATAQGRPGPGAPQAHRPTQQRPQQNQPRTQQQPQQNQLRPQPPPQQNQSRPGPRLSPRAQWEIDAETARLKAQVEAEAREQTRKEDSSRKMRRKQEQVEERKTIEFLEQERRQKQRSEQEQRRKQAAVDKETERLRKQYGDQSHVHRPVAQAQRHSEPLIQHQWQQAQQAQRQVASRPAPAPTQPPQMQIQAPLALAPYPRPSGHQPAASQSSFFNTGFAKPQILAKAKKSFWGLRTQSDTIGEKMKKKKSSMF